MRAHLVDSGVRQRPAASIGGTQPALPAHQHRANDCGGKLRLTASTSPVGNVAKVSEVVAPKFPPPPPHNAQNRSGWELADAVTVWPPGSTTVADRNASDISPVCREWAPSPPPRAWPAAPTDGQVPVGIPRPAAARTWCIAYRLVAGVTVT